MVADRWFLSAVCDPKITERTNNRVRRKTMAEPSGLLANKVEPLSGANYQVWAMKVGAILRSRKLFRDVIEGFEPARALAGSNEAKERDLWESKNDEAFGIIILTLSQEQAGMFIGETKAKKVWEELKRIHTGTVEVKKNRYMP